MGYASSADAVQRDIERSGISAGGIDYLLPTHVHLDHSGACGRLAAHFKNASIRVHPKGQRHLIDPTTLWEGAGQLFGDELMKQYGRPQPIEADRVGAIADEEEIDLGNGLVLRSIWTPGHASHHLSYNLEGKETVFTGDAVGISSHSFLVLIPTTPPTSFNLDAAVESLRRIRQLSPKRLLTPHFGVINHGEDSIDANISSLVSWTAEIAGLLKRGSSIDSIVTTLTEEIARRTTNPTAPLPDYLQLSVRVSVLGAVRYLKSSDRS
jgi:glyoxylase-like metal-dependent hydrolase (beta-lactamase superfamily II)